MLRTRKPTSSADSQTGTIFLATTVRPTWVWHLGRVLVAMPQAVAEGATDSPHSAAVLPVPSLTSMPRTSLASRSSIARLRLPAGVVPCREAGVLDVEVRTSHPEGVLLVAAVEDLTLTGEVPSAVEGGEVGGIGKRYAIALIYLYVHTNLFVV